MKKTKLVIAAAGVLDSTDKPIDFEQCFICQGREKDAGPLNNPASNPIISKRGLGYIALAANLEKLKPYPYKLTCGRHVSEFDEGGGILDTLRAKNAKWHRSCAYKFLEKSRFETLLKEEEDKQRNSKLFGETEARCYETRSGSQPLKLKDDVCFLCAGVATYKRSLHQCETDDVFMNVKAAAVAIGDTKLLAVLETGGHLAAQEAKYHSNCLAKLYNKKAQAECVTQGDRNEVFCESMAFADMVLYMESLLQTSPTYVFRMGELTKIYLNRMKQLLAQAVNVHTTRLREKILGHFPNMQAMKSGREYVLLMKGVNFMNNLNDDQDEDALAFHRFVQNLRKCVMNTTYEFPGHFTPTSGKDSIPGVLLAALSTLCYGSSDPSSSGAIAPLLTICQLIMTNMKKTMPQGDIVRHNKTMEFPLPLYMGLSMYGNSRDRKAIDDMHQKGMSVSSNRVTCVTSQLSRMVTQRARDEKIVCPSNLRTGLFTVTAFDNVDVKSTSNTSQGDFHGTSISVFQYRTPENEGQIRNFITSYADVAAGGDRNVPDLPDFYSDVSDCVLLSVQPAYPGCRSDISNRIVTERAAGHRILESSWLSHIYRNLTGLQCDEEVSWSAFHAKNEVGVRKLACINALLPLFHEKSSSPAMVRHGMDITLNLTKHLNGGQIAVMALDQPLFAIGKTIQWNWPEKYGSEKLLLMFGSLHIEMDFLRVLGNFMEGCGWLSIVINSHITTAGSADALLKVTHVKRSREMHQITAAVLHSLLAEAYEQENHGQEQTLEEWISIRSKKSPTFFFWLQLLHLEILLLCFVRSVRQGCYSLYKECLQRMLPWFFLFNKHNYARWLTVHVADLEELEHTAPKLHEEFMLKKFVVSKKGLPFSDIGIDHAHEQNNKDIKGSGGAIGLTHDPMALRRFTIGGPEVTRLLKEFRQGDRNEDDNEGIHHEKTVSYQLRFLDKCIALKDSFHEFQNPFTVQEPLLIVIDESRVVMDNSVGVALYKAEDKGKNLVKEFVQERLVQKVKSVYDPIKKCQLVIFGGPKKNTLKTPLIALKSEIQLFGRLFIISLGRSLDLDQFFEHENQRTPPSLSLNGGIRSGDKSQLVVILEKLVHHEERLHPKSADAVALDGAVLVHTVKPIDTMKTFQEYVHHLAKSIRKLATDLGAKRIDIVWDLYSALSLKGFTRENRGSSARRFDLPAKGKLPKNWEEYLRNDANKQELFEFLARSLVVLLQDFHFVTNVGAHLISTSGLGTSLTGVTIEALEEADGRLILHTMDMVSTGAKSTVIRSNDTDVVVLAISFFPALRDAGLKELWVQYGVGKHRRYIPAHKIAEIVGDRKAIALRAFHAITGCDTVSFFATKGKRSAFSAWTKEDETDAFVRLSQPTEGDIDEELIDIIEKFVVRMYGVKEDNCVTVNAARKHLFATLSRPVQSIPPTKNALVQHIRRAAYQAGQVWGRAADGSHPPSPDSWGWTLSDSKWTPVWTEDAPIWSECRSLDRCNCTTGCQNNRCKCRKHLLPCTLQCKCKGQCCNPHATALQVSQTKETEEEDGNGD